MTLGLTDGTENFGLYNTGDYGLGSSRDSYGMNVNSSSGTGGDGSLTTRGITTDPAKSGIICLLSNNSITAIIKY